MNNWKKKFDLGVIRSYNNIWPNQDFVSVDNPRNECPQCFASNSKKIWSQSGGEKNPELTP